MYMFVYVCVYIYIYICEVQFCVLSVQSQVPCLDPTLDVPNSFFGPWPEQSRETLLGFGGGVSWSLWAAAWGIVGFKVGRCRHSG